MTTTELTDTHLLFHGPGAFVVTGDISETIEVEEGKTRKRKLPAESGSVFVNLELIEWGDTAPPEPEKQATPTRRPYSRIRYFLGPTGVEIPSKESD